MSSTSKPIPVAVAGQTHAVGGPVAQYLAPEYEVVHFAEGYDAVRAEIPLVLAGQDPQSSSTHGVGTRNYAEAPRAVIVGRGFNIAQVEEFRELTKQTVTTSVLWLLGDPAKKPTGSMGTERATAERQIAGYAKQTALDAKAKLDQWFAEGASKDGIVLY